MSSEMRTRSSGLDTTRLDSMNIFSLYTRMSATTLQDTTAATPVGSNSPCSPFYSTFCTDTICVLFLVLVRMPINRGSTVLLPATSSGLATSQDDYVQIPHSQGSTARKLRLEHKHRGKHAERRTDLLNRPARH